MFALLTSQSGLPIVVSQNSIEYVHLIISGYQEQASGQKRAMKEKEDEILKELYFDNFDYGIA